MTFTIGQSAVADIRRTVQWGRLDEAHPMVPTFHALRGFSRKKVGCGQHLPHDSSAFVTPLTCIGANYTLSNDPTLYNAINSQNESTTIGARV